jgi:hypothetical protein
LAFEIGTGLLAYLVVPFSVLGISLFVYEGNIMLLSKLGCPLLLWLFEGSRNSVSPGVFKGIVLEFIVN